MVQVVIVEREMHDGDHASERAAERRETMLEWFLGFPVLAAGIKDINSDQIHGL